MSSFGGFQSGKTQRAREEAEQRRQQQEAPPPQTPGEREGVGITPEYIPGEEAGEAGKETRGN